MPALGLVLGPASLLEFGRCSLPLFGRAPHAGLLQQAAPQSSVVAREEPASSRLSAAALARLVLVLHGIPLWVRGMGGDGGHLTA